MPWADFVNHAVKPLTGMFPVKCSCCGRHGKGKNIPHLCDYCFGEVALLPGNVCSLCGRGLDFEYEIDTGDLYTCGRCLKNPPVYTQAHFALSYEGPAREMIHKLKFSGSPYLARPLAMLGRDTLVPWLDTKPEAVIVPVPLARRKLLLRGYNPTYLLARWFGKWTRLEVAEGSIRRVKNTAPQFGLKEKERRKNVKGAFKPYDPQKLRGRDVILFDDIYTTGATINECVKVINTARPARILVAALCHAGDG